MSRKLEIDDYCKSQGFEELRYGIKTNEELIARHAIEWADETMIEKAYDWFSNMFLDYVQGDVRYVFYDDLKKDFFKEMRD